MKHNALLATHWDNINCKCHFMVGHTDNGDTQICDHPDQDDETKGVCIWTDYGGKLECNLYTKYTKPNP